MRQVREKRMSELKPLLNCPFCGDPGVMAEPETGGFRVVCNSYALDCAGATRIVGNPWAAAEAWNRRTPSAEPAKSDLIARRQEKIADLLQRWIDFNTSPANLTSDIVEDKACFRSFMDSINEKEGELIAESEKTIKFLREAADALSEAAPEGWQLMPTTPAVTVSGKR